MNESQLLGIGAGLTTSALWTITSIFFTAGGKRIGSTLLNTSRLVAAVFLHGIYFAVLHQGSIWPQLSDEQLIYLMLSGLIGFTLCDQALFTAFLYIGPRRALLVMTTSPIFALVFGWFALDESLGLIKLGAIGLTIIGVLVVILDRRKRMDVESAEKYAAGIILAFIAAATQALGLLLSKMGMQAGADYPAIDAQSASYVRVTFGALGMAPVILFAMSGPRRKTLTPPKGEVKWRAGLTFAFVGAVTGPFLGVWASLVAADNLPVGIAQTVSSLAPVFIVPIAWKLYNEHVGPRSLVGALLAVGGIALLAFAQTEPANSEPVESPAPITAPS